MSRISTECLSARSCCWLPPEVRKLAAVCLPCQWRRQVKANLKEHGYGM